MDFIDGRYQTFLHSFLRCCNSVLLEFKFWKLAKSIITLVIHSASFLYLSASPSLLAYLFSSHSALLKWKADEHKFFVAQKSTFSTFFFYFTSNIIISSSVWVQNVWFFLLLDPCYLLTFTPYPAIRECDAKQLLNYHLARAPLVGTKCTVRPGFQSPISRVAQVSNMPLLPSLRKAVSFQALASFQMYW